MADDRKTPLMPPPHESSKQGDGPAQGAAMLPTEEIERILGKLVAEKAGISAPYVHHIKWLWVQGKGPVAHVKVTPAPIARLPRKP